MCVRVCASMCVCACVHVCVCACDLVCALHVHTSDQQLISQNQQAFIDLLNEPLEQGGVAGNIGSQGVPDLAGNPAMSRMMGGVQGGLPMGGPPPGTMAIQVTPQEKEAIDRVRNLCVYVCVW